MFIAVHNNVYALMAGSETPLDAMMLRTALLMTPSGVEFRRAVEGRLGYPDMRKLLEYYRSGAREWYLVWGNDVVARERRAITVSLSRISGRLAYALGAWLVGS